MKTLKTAISLLLMSSVSAIADDTASTGVASSLPMITAITSGAKPAVDGLNGKAEFFGGAAQANASNGGSLPYMATTQPHKIDGSNLWYGTGGAAGTISVPVGHSFGIQVDAVSGLYTNAYTGGGAGHFFWRDPDKGLVGVYGSGLYSALNKGSGTWQAAGEAELYYGHITIGGLVGIQGYTNNYYIPCSLDNPKIIG